MTKQGVNYSMWIVINRGEEELNSTYEVTSYNEAFNSKTGEYELWIERKTGKTILLMSSKNKIDILEMKQALDFAIAQGEKAFEITF